MNILIIGDKNEKPIRGWGPTAAAIRSTGSSEFIGHPAIDDRPAESHSESSNLDTRQIDRVAAQVYAAAFGCRPRDEHPVPPIPEERQPERQVWKVNYII